MIQISKNQFLEMFSLGILSGNKKESKEFTVTCRAKKSKNKTRYVNEADYERYLKRKSKSNNDS